MLKNRVYGLFFILIFLVCGPVAAEDNSGFKLEPIVVSKAKVHLSSAYSVRYDTAGDLPADSPVETLGITPVDLQSRSLKEGIQTDFSLRGSTFQGVLMLLSGQRINDPQTAHHNSDLPFTSQDLERIEVIPGAGSSVFGPDAMGGAINFQVKKPQERKLFLELKGGEYRTGSVLFSASDKINNIGARISVENAQSGGFKPDTDFRKFTSNLTSSVDLPNGAFNLNFGYQEKEFGAFDFYTPGSKYESKEWTKTFLLNTGLVLEKEGLTIKPNFLWRRHFDKFLLDKTLQRSTYRNDHRTDMFTPNIYFQKDAGIIGKAGLGLEYGQELIRSSNLGKHIREHQSIFLDDSKDLPGNLSLGASFRFDDFSTFDGVNTGSLALKYSLNDFNSFNLGVSRSMRIPSFTELYYSDPTTLGDANLSAESALNYQAGYDFKSSRVAYNGTFFFRQEKDVIDWVKHSPSQAKWQVENITSDKVLGFENNIKLKLNKIADLNAGYTYVNKNINESGLIYKYGPNYTKHLFNSALIFHLPFGAQELGFVYKKKPGRGGWFLLSMRLSYDINRNSQVFFEGTNLGNVDYEEIEGIPQPGRWLEGGVRLQW
ncbi:MAG: TonB-dependent receptor [Candidatus Omnitrophica bacterium]|nr:TonB-dependent receptor [Candidatus Omnitrophota bacterium]